MEVLADNSHIDLKQHLEATPPAIYMDLPTPTLTPRVSHSNAVVVEPSPRRWPLVITDLSSFTPPPPASPDHDSPFSMVEKDITTMNLELETPVDVVSITDFTATGPEAPTNHSAERSKPRDLEYYMDMVVFEVEDTLFRVPTHYFKASTDFFNQEFESSAEKADHGEEKALRLEDVTKAEFRALLHLMYPLPLTVTRTLSDDEWVSVLKLSTMWMMLDVRRMAIEYLTSATMPPAERVVLARKYSVVEWLRSAYAALVEDVACISLEDASKIGLESVFKLHLLKEQVLSACSSERLPVNYEGVVQAAFKGELGAMNEAGKDAIDRAVLAREYNVVEWLRAAFIELVARSQSLSVDEARTLGYETAIRLCGARERRISYRTGFWSPTPNGILVDQELGTELQALSSRGIVDRVFLAWEYGVAKWFQSALVELAVREERISVDEATRLGLQTAIEVCRVRQMRFHPEDRSFASHYENAIDEEFEKELRNVRLEGDQYCLPARIEIADEPERKEELEKMPTEPEAGGEGGGVKRLVTNKKKKKKGK